MLEDQSILKVHCETHDDILVMRTTPGAPTIVAEFIQVKSNEPDQLWSPAKLCAPKIKDGADSIFETSLSRDCHSEEPRFRLVTLRDVHSSLRFLTYAIGHGARAPGQPCFNEMVAELKKRCPNAKSPKGNGASFWLERCFWDCRGNEKSIQNNNTLRLLQLARDEERLLLTDHALVLLDELRSRAKAAASAKWVPDRDKKIILRAELRAWWEQRTAEILSAAIDVSGRTLAEKMEAAGLPPDLIELARELRRDYSEAVRSARYLELDQGQQLARRVKAEMASLRSRVAAGELDVDGAALHARYLQAIDAIEAALPAGSLDRPAFLKGCLYDIADRCLLRFTGTSP